MFDTDYVPLDLEVEDYAKNNDTWEYCYHCGKATWKQEFEANKGYCNDCAEQ